MLPEPGSFLVRRAAVSCLLADRTYQQVWRRLTTVTTLILSRQSVFRFTGDACFLLSALFLHSFAFPLVPQPAHMQRIENELKNSSRPLPSFQTPPTKLRAGSPPSSSGRCGSQGTAANLVTLRHTGRSMWRANWRFLKEILPPLYQNSFDLHA